MQMTCNYMYHSNPTDFETLSDIESCASDVSRWFTENALLLNPTKTEAVVFGTSQRLPQVNKSQGVWVTGAHVQFTDAVKLLGVTLDSTLSFDKHIIDVTRSCHYHIRAVRHIRPLLTLDAAKAIWLLLSLAAGLITATVYCMVCRRRTSTSYSACKISCREL